MPIDPILSADFFNNQNNDNFFQRPFSSCNSVMSPGYNGFPSAIIPNPFNPPPINIMPFLTNRSPFINDHQTPNESYIGFPTSNVNNNHLNNFKVFLEFFYEKIIYFFQNFSINSSHSHL